MNKKQKIGEFGEKIAEEFLLRNNYEIVSKNIKISYQEIDIIAKKNKMFIFVEVKTRTSFKFGNAEDSVGSKKIKNLKKAIGNYIYDKKINGNFIRLDLISININKIKKTANIKHYKDIF